MKASQNSLPTIARNRKHVLSNSFNKLNFGKKIKSKIIFLSKYRFTFAENGTIFGSRTITREPELDTALFWA